MFELIGFLLIGATCLTVFMIVIDFWSMRWPVVEGEVLKTFESERRSSIVSNTVIKSFFIKYEYYIGDKRLQNSRIFVGSRRGNPGWKSDLVKIDNGIESVTVHFCPYLKSYSVLRPNSISKLLGLAIIAMCLSVGGVCLSIGS